MNTGFSYARTLDLRLQHSEHLFLKIGSSSILTVDGFVNQKVLEECAQQITQLQAQQRRISLVCSGAVDAGRSQLQRRGIESPSRREAALVGQSLLNEAWVSLGRGAGLDVRYHLLRDAEIPEAIARQKETSPLQVDIFNGDDARMSDIDQLVRDNDRLTLELATLAGAKCIILFTQRVGQGGNWGTGGYAGKMTLIQEMQTRGIQAEVWYIDQLGHLANRLMSPLHLAAHHIARSQERSGAQYHSAERSLPPSTTKEVPVM